MTLVLQFIAFVSVFSIGFVSGACWHHCHVPPIESDDVSDDPDSWWESGDIRLTPIDPKH